MSSASSAIRLRCWDRCRRGGTSSASSAIRLRCWDRCSWGGTSSASSAKELRKDGIAPRASERDIAGLKRAAQSLSRQRGRVGGVVQPPGAVIIVEVVVWVVGPDAYRGLVVFIYSHVVRG
jgi:hypothetical protein